MAVGAWVGWQTCWRVAVAAVIFGGIYSLGEIIFRGRLAAVVMSTYSFMRSLLVPALVPEKLRLDENRKFAFGICVALPLHGFKLFRSVNEHINTAYPGGQEL